MAGTKIGGRKAKATILHTNPAHWAEAGELGGSVKGVIKGFAANPELAKSWSKKAAEIRWAKVRAEKAKIDK